MKTIFNTVIGIFIGLLLAGALFLTVRMPGGEAIQLMPSATPKPLMVYVTGAVLRAGVYELPRDSRMVDAVRAAGGFVQGADLNQVNLAELVKDGDQIIIPGLSTLPTPQLTIGDTGLLVTPTPYPGAPVNVNTATPDELAACKCGLTPTMAQNVVAYRIQNGPFKTIDDLIKVPGISSNIMDIIKKDARLVVLP